MKYSRIGTMAIMGLFLLGVVIMAFNSDASEDFLNSPQGTALIPLFIAIIVIATTLPFSPILFSWLDIRKKRSILRARGVKGTGKVIDVLETGITINNNPYPLIRIQVDESHISEICVTVSRLSIPRTGDMIDIVYDPSNPAIALPSSLLN